MPSWPRSTSRSKQLGLDDATYRDFLFATTGHRSAAELSDAQRQQVIELLRSRGFRRTAVAEKRQKRIADNSQLGMIQGLWRRLKVCRGAYRSERAAPIRVHKKTDGDRARRMAKSARGDRGDRGSKKLARSRGRKDGAGRMKWLVEKLPRGDRSFVDQYLVDHDFRGYDDLVELLRRRGLDIGVGALKGYSRRLRSKRAEDRMVARTTAAALLTRGPRRKEVASS